MYRTEACSRNIIKMLSEKGPTMGSHPRTVGGARFWDLTSVFNESKNDGRFNGKACICIAWTLRRRKFFRVAYRRTQRARQVAQYFLHSVPFLLFSGGSVPFAGRWKRSFHRIPFVRRANFRRNQSGEFRERKDDACERPRRVSPGCSRNATVILFYCSTPSFFGEPSFNRHWSSSILTAGRFTWAKCEVPKWNADVNDAR